MNVRVDEMTMRGTPETLSDRVSVLKLLATIGAVEVVSSQAI
jgi:hypothetical protein